MDLKTIRKNLIQTISGKREAVKVYQDYLASPGTDKDYTFVLSARVATQYLGINITELEAILADVDKCIAATGGVEHA